MKKIFKNLSMAKKLLSAPIVVICFLLVLSYVSYSGLSSQKTAMEDIFNNRFKIYQKSSEIAENIAEVHGNLYKSISWASANYEMKAIQTLANEQKVEIKRNIELVKDILKSTTLTGKERKSFQVSLDQLIPKSGELNINSF